MQSGFGDMAIFSIPFEFTSSEGNLSFEYLIGNDNGNTLTVTVCQGDVIPAFTLGGSQSAEQYSGAVFMC